MIADLHIHSKYSRATSAQCVPEHLDLWARRKGIGLVGTGDFTHPAWRAELAEKLERDRDGLYVLKEACRLSEEVPGVGTPRFVVTGEISTIYKKDGKVRKVHSLILLPDLEAAEELSRRLEVIGNIRSDGRPILGLDCRDLLEITLEACPRAVFIPAHIWTPHFSVFGAFSGFDRLEDCFGDLTGEIHALETGLSSDPPMNWRLSALDGYQLVSHSDAHSPAKLGREADLLDINPDYDSLRRALCTGEGLLGTLEFFPEEGKYHLDGHRTCNQCLTPVETVAAGGRCPVCGKKLTIGVLHRVEELADRPEGFRPQGAKDFQSLVPLPEVIAASLGGSPESKKNAALYGHMLSRLGPEFHILRDAPVEDIEHTAGPCVAEGIRRLRSGKVERTAGYDGVYGKIGLLTDAEREALSGQVSLFGTAVPAKKKVKENKSLPVKQAAGERLQRHAAAAAGLNEAQRAAVEADGRTVAVSAGPGTGKTRTLAWRIAHLIEDCGVSAGNITAVTFTNRAAEELRQRLEHVLGGKRALRGLTVGTFHAISLKNQPGVCLLDQSESLALAEMAAGEAMSTEGLLRAVSMEKNGLPQTLSEAERAACEAYKTLLEERGAMDFDDLLLAELARAEGAADKDLRSFTHLLVDEFQDCDPIQYRLLRAWNRAGESLFVIGDPDQSIYGFRGGDGACWQRLAEDWPQVCTVCLTANYRSRAEILRCALPVIEKNGGGPRGLHSVPGPGGAVRLVTADSPLSQGIFVAREIGRQVGGMDMVSAGGEAARTFSDFAVCCRTRRQLELLEECLRKEGIPCAVAGRGGFLTHRTVRGALAFFRALAWPEREDPSLALMLGFDCPLETARRAAEAWKQGTGSPVERARAAEAACPDVDGLSRFRALMEQLAPLMGRDKPVRLLKAYDRAAGQAGMEPLERLMNMAVFHRRMEDFLFSLTVGREADLLRSAGQGYRAGYVTLTTLHAAKGLEFPVVFLCGVEKGLLPYRSRRRASDPAEERRLFYVGMTRAMEELILVTGPEPSPFLADIPPEALGTEQVARPARSGDGQLSLF